jgi:hypothetical protein
MPPEAVKSVCERTPACSMRRCETAHRRKPSRTRIRCRVHGSNDGRNYRRASSKCAHVTRMHLGGKPLACHVMLLEASRGRPSTGRHGPRHGGLHPDQFPARLGLRVRVRQADDRPIASCNQPGPESTRSGSTSHARRPAERAAQDPRRRIACLLFYYWYYQERMFEAGR